MRTRGMQKVNSGGAAGQSFHAIASVPGSNFGQPASLQVACDLRAGSSMFVLVREGIMGIEFHPGLENFLGKLLIVVIVIHEGGNAQPQPAKTAAEKGFRARAKKPVNRREGAKQPTETGERRRGGQ